MKNCIFLCCLLTVCFGRPQEEVSGRIVFDSKSEDVGEGCRQGEVSFQGECYWRGERGPCKQGQVIWIDDKFPDPHCIPFVPGMEAAIQETRDKFENVDQTSRKKVNEERGITKLTKSRQNSNEELPNSDERATSFVSMDQLETETTTLPILPKLPGLIESDLSEDEEDPEEQVITNPGPNTELSVESHVEESAPVKDSECHQQGQVLWPEDGSCHTLLTQGPCPARQWLQVVSSSPHLVVECVAKPCQGEDQVWWPGTCECVDREGEEERRLCGQGEELLWSPLGEGVCACKQDAPHEEAEDGVCHELGIRGPCEEGFVWKLGEDGGPAQCVDGNAFTPRIFDLIPFNGGRFATMRNCHVDSRGRCRRRIRFNRRGKRQARGDRGKRQAIGDRGRRQARGDRGRRQARGDRGRRQAIGDRGRRQAIGDRGKRQAGGAEDDRAMNFLEWIVRFSNFTKPSCL